MGHPLEDVLAALVGRYALPEDANHVRMGAIPALAEVRVFDGPTPDEPDEELVLGIGVSAGEATSAFGTEVPSWGGREEVSFDVGFIAESFSGEVDVAARRSAVMAIFEAVRTDLVADEDLGGVCTRAFVAGWQYSAAQGEDGSMARLEFTVRVDATRFDEGE